MCRICIAEVCVRSSVERLRRVRRGPAHAASSQPHRRGGRRRRKRLGQIERVLHVARRMLGRHVERFEVVVVVFDFGPFEHLVAEAREDLLHLFAHQAERMAKAEDRRAAGQRHVHRAGGPARRGERGFAFGDRGFDRLLQLVGQPPDRAASPRAWPGRRVHERGDPLPLRPTQRVRSACRSASVRTRANSS